MDSRFFDPQQQGAQGDLMLYHYTTPAGFAGILDSGRLRLSTMRSMNDPREADDFRQVGSGGPELNRLLKDRVHVAAFTEEGIAATSEGYFARGFARARNWAQYGASHRGAVLAFKREHLLAAADEALPGVKSGQITYRDTAAWDKGALDDAWCQRQAGEDDAAYADRILASEWRELYLVKNTDWKSESEFRLLYWGEEVAEIPIRHCLEGIVVGRDFPRAETSVIGTRLRQLGIPRVQIFQLTWADGAPYPQMIDLPDMVIDPSEYPDTLYYRPTSPP